jgi:hypothetical protein
VSSVHRSTLTRSGLVGHRALATLLATIAWLGVGCEDESVTDSSVVAASQVPPEILVQLSSLETAMNRRSADDLARLLDDNASVQTAALLGYGSKSQFLDSIASAGAASPFKFGGTVLVSERPGRIRTLSEVIRRFGQDQVVERVSHDWVRQGDRWVVKEQSFPDWSPLVGSWWRKEGDAMVKLKILPSGIFEITDSSEIAVRRGVYATGMDEVAFTPDAIGAGATDERSIHGTFKFEFDGSLEVLVASGQEAPGIPSLGGVWKRQTAR